MVLGVYTFGVVFYGYETWSVTIREEHRLRVFDNRVLRKIFGAKRDEVTGKWKEDEVYYLYASQNAIWVIKHRRMRWAGHVARMGERRFAYRALVGNPEDEWPLERPRRR
jgi:hypothetical protein